MERKKIYFQLSEVIAIGKLPSRSQDILPKQNPEMPDSSDAR